MASICVSDIKDIPGYKVILNAVLKAQILQLVDQLAVETNEESVLITANITDGTLSHLGSNFGNIFLNTYTDVKEQFLGFCLHEYQNRLTDTTVSEDASTSPEKKSPKLPKGPRKRKKAALYTRKSKRTAYQNLQPELETLQSYNEAALETIAQDIGDGSQVLLNVEKDNLNNICNDFTPEISNVSGNVKSFDTENERTNIDDNNKSEKLEASFGLEKKETAKDIDTSVSRGECSVPEEPLENISKSEVVQDTDKLKVKECNSKSPQKGKKVKKVKSVNKKGKKGKKETKKNDDNGSDTDTTIEWSEQPDSPDIPVLQDDVAKQIKKEPEDFSNEPPDIVGSSKHGTEQQDCQPSKHVIVTKHTTYDSAEDDDNAENVTEQCKITEKSLQLPEDDKSVVDNKVDEEVCSKDESVKDSPDTESSVEKKINENGNAEKKKNNTKKGKVVKKKGKRGRKPGKASAKVVKEVVEEPEKEQIIKETDKKKVDVLEECNQNIDQITDSVARAISEERKEKLAVLDIQSGCLDSVSDQDQLKDSEGNDNDKNDILPMSNNLVKSKVGEKPTEETKGENDDDAIEDKLKEKSMKVLAIWNEIVSDTNEASTDVLYDLIADKIKQSRDKLSVERECKPDSQSNKSDIVNNALKPKNVPAEPVAKITSDLQEKEHLKETESSVSQNDKNSALRNVRHSSCESSSSTLSKPSEDHNTDQELVEGKIEGTSAVWSKSNAEENTTSKISTNNSNDQQDRSEKQTAASGSHVDAGRDSADGNSKTNKDTLKHGNIPVVIDVDANVRQTAKSSTPNTVRATTTPVKQVANKVSQNTPKQARTPTHSVNRQTAQSVTPAKPGKGKSLVDNLISTGVPIIIPDDDDDDDNVKESNNEFISYSRSSNSFEVKSKQYKETQHLRGKKQMMQAAQRQEYGAYTQQASPSQRAPNVASSYSQYPQQLQQHYHHQQKGYHYQEYQETQQFRNQHHHQQYQYGEYFDEQQYDQQALSEQFHSQQSHNALQQLVFTPPKSGTVQRSQSQRTPTYQSRESSPQLHNFSSPTTPTAPKGNQYFKQGYVTPTKSCQKVTSHSPQARISSNQSPASKQSLQQSRYSSAPKPNIPIVIEDEASRIKRRGQMQTSFTQYQQSFQREGFVAKTPVTDPQQIPPGQACEVSTNYEEFLRLQQQQQKKQELQQQQQEKHQQALHQFQQQQQQQLQQQQKQHQIIPGVEERKPSAGFVDMPVVSNVANVPIPDRDNFNDSSVQKSQFTPIPPPAGVDNSFIRQANERTPIKRIRSDETEVSPATIAAEPLNKRRHTSSDSNSSMSLTMNTKSPVISPESSQGHAGGQISPSKIPPKLEIDVDDVRGAELGGQMVQMRSPSMSSQPSETSASDRAERPSIPLPPQLVRSDLKSFSPPVSPSTKRLIAAPGTHPSGTSAHSSGDDSSVTSQETTPSQPLKKFGCGDCGKSYTTKAALNQHFRKHTQERPFECDVCGKHYSQKGYLKKHILTHFEEK